MCALNRYPSAKTAMGEHNATKTLAAPAIKYPTLILRMQWEEPGGTFGAPNTALEHSNSFGVLSIDPDLSVRLHARRIKIHPRPKRMHIANGSNRHPDKKSS